ncbi:hypothetical protein W97_08930 [Coniosporium apollinis CBS 100218]|uniref:AB hydrolase-1 domain-containing protein n=1 Tax=Coniosporium apollinis (strain CBS 100218) TaxID=1168221 RepID=R7Z6F5_CONA1|nr:uncharacterized protein W97_08930 [Coniosporium apollinis CBS 100218]EON69678.1 hypothetical protein W97_08930 [Coniosporium apollinis CBS 100218]
MATQQTATTHYILAANGTRFAHRRLGRATGVPLVMHIHFRANMDFWDPALINALAATRPVILFDQAGVGRSTGSIPTTFQGWADDLIALITALNINEIDLFGFSMGGAAVQMVALTAPSLVRKLVLAGTAASEPSPLVSDLRGIVWPRDVPPSEPIKLLATARTPAEIGRALAYSFFHDTDEGRAGAKAYWGRVSERHVSGEPRLLDLVDADTGGKRQRAAYQDWLKPNPRNSFDRLGELKMPVLVMNGDHDALIPTSRSWEMQARIPNAQLIVYPRAGHGFLYQYAELVAAHVNIFLDVEDYGDATAKL